MLAPNTILQNRYQIIQLLGQGGMGAVYRASDMRLRQIVALKENIGGDVQQFQQEALILANLRHPNLPRVSDHFVESNGAQYLAMDFIEGENLEAYVNQQGALPEAQVLLWFDQILDAVSYLHTRGIIHRDIKPSNIKITPSGQAILVDFGIAKVYQTGQYTMTGAKAMTPGFAAPEQYLGGTDWRSDVYSLGATLYTVLTGSVPPDAQALQNRSGQLVPPRALNPALTARIERVILRAMELLPQQRFENADAMRHALKSNFTGATIAATSAKQRNNKPLLLILAGVLGIFVVFGIGGFLWVVANSSPTQIPTKLAINTRVPTRTKIPTETQSIPTIPLVLATSTLALPTFTLVPPTFTLIPPTFTSIPATATLVPPSFTPTVRSAKGQIAFTTNRDGNYEIYIMNTDGTNPRNLTNNSAGDFSPSWSPDGQFIAFTSARNRDKTQIYVMNSDGTNLRQLSDLPTGALSPAWSQDGQLIAFSIDLDGFDEIWVMSSDGTNPRRITVSSKTIQDCDLGPSWAPDGRTIAYFVGCVRNAPGIYLVNVDGTDKRRLTDGGEGPAWSPNGRLIAFYCGTPGICVMNADGTNLHKITDDSIHRYRPTWSPDGRFIAFDSDDGGIYIMNADGTNQHRIADGYAPSWSPN